MFWKLEPLKGWREGVAILWGAVLGAGLGIWAETCRYATGVADIDDLYVQDYIPWDVFVNPLYIGYGAIMGLLWAAIFAKVQKSFWAWAVASIATIAICAILPYRVEGSMHQQASAIALAAPTAFAVVHGLWIFPWRQRPWTEFIEDEDQDSHV